MWLSKVKIRHLYTEQEDHKSICQSMNDIADVLSNSLAFHTFQLEDFRSIPKGDHVIGALDYANKLLDRMYNYADENRIWIE